MCFGSKDNPFGSFEIKRLGRLSILRVDYEPPLPAGETKDLKLADQNDDPVTPEGTTSDNVHFDFRFDSKPYGVEPGQTFSISEIEKSGSGKKICVSVWGYYSPLKG